QPGGNRRRPAPLVRQAGTARPARPPSRPGPPYWSAETINGSRSSARQLSGIGSSQRPAKPPPTSIRSPSAYVSPSRTSPESDPEADTWSAGQTGSTWVPASSRTTRRSGLDRGGGRDVVAPGPQPPADQPPAHPQERREQHRAEGGPAD